jgi:hypothetical protein
MIWWPNTTLKEQEQQSFLLKLLLGAKGEGLQLVQEICLPKNRLKDGKR